MIRSGADGAVRFLRFAVVGASGFVFDYGVLYAGAWLGLGWYLARVPAWFAAATFTWACNRRFTFATSAPPSWREWGAFLAANATGGLVNYAVYAALLHGFAVVGAHPVLALAAGAIAALGVNFALSARFVFGRSGAT